MPDWSDTSRFVAFSMVVLQLGSLLFLTITALWCADHVCFAKQNGETKGEIYVAFNTSHLPVIVTLPDRPGYRWDPLVDTSKPAPYDFLCEDLADRATAIRQFENFVNSNLYPMLSYSSIILVLRPEDA
jgi:isoamylase